MGIFDIKNAGFIAFYQNQFPQINKLLLKLKNALSVHLA